MNPENSPAPREAVEMRLTALLMGELSPEDAAALEAQMAGDAELAALYGRLRKAMELLREASALPEPATPPTPAQLSSERRARLLAHFQKPVVEEASTILPTPIVRKPRRDWAWTVPMGIAALVIVLIGGALLGPASSLIRPKRAEKTPDFGYIEQGQGGQLGVALGSLGGEPPVRATVQLNQGTLVANTATASVGSGLVLNGSIASSSNVAGNGAVDLNGITPGVTASEEPKPPFTTAVTGTGSVVLNGGGSLTLTGSNTYSGGIVITDGFSGTFGGTISGNFDQQKTVAVKVTTASGGKDLAGEATPVDLGAFNFSGDDRTGDKMIRHELTIPPAGVASTSTFAGVGGVTKSGTGSLMISSSNAFSGTTTIAGGTLTLGGVETPFRPELVTDKKEEDAAKLASATPSPARARELKQAGDMAMKAKDYDKAAAYYKDAVDLAPSAPDTQTLRSDALGKFSDASTKLAEKLITEGRYADAENTLRGVLDERYDPRSKKAITILSRLEQPDYYNKIIGPKFRASTEQAKQWFIEAQGFYDTGRFALAKKRTEQILQIDPANVAARRFEEKIDHAFSDYGVASYNEARADPLATTDMAWARPIRRFNVPTDDPAAAGTDAIRGKLDSIIIPKVELHEATLQEAIDYLKKKSVELDGSSPVGQKGTNIVLKTGPPAGTPVTPQAGEAKPAVSPADARITVSLTDVPLREALAYVTGLANTKYRIEPYAISVVPVTENTEVVLTKEWKVPPELIPHTAGSAEKTTFDREAAKDWLRSKGIAFNGNTSAVYIAKSGRLIVRNTQDQLDLVDKVIESQPKAKEEEATKTAPASAPTPQPETQTSANAFSTFSLNVSDVSFKLAAASLEQSHMPDPAAVRSEEFINAFDYRDPEPATGAPLAFATERARYPFAQNRDLLRIALKTAAAGRQPGHPLNVVLLLDKSGSMERADRVNIVREALRVLAGQLQPQDKLSIVTFARTPRLWADGVAGDKVGETIARVGEITPDGGTNLEAALDLGYATALRHSAPGSINRVVLFTDGAANLGNVDPDALTKKVEAKRQQGVALDCFGIGWEGYNDDLLEQLTRHADGRYGFINTPEEATTNFAAQLVGALQVAAADVKVQVEFNPRRVTAYRQIGYAKHQLTKEQFRDNTVDAAEIGAKESGNALYIVEVDPRGSGDLATVRVRFKVPGTSDYREHEWAVPFTGDALPLEQASSSLRLAGAASAFSEMLATSPYAAEVTSDRLLNLLNGVPAIYGADPRPTKLEWMIRQAKSLSGR